MTVGAMMGMMLKNETDHLTIQIRGDGPLGSLVVDANPRGEVRGYVQNPHVHLSANAEGKLNVGGGIGKGTLNVVKDLGLKEPYRGSVELVSGELAEDFAYYFTVSGRTRRQWRRECSFSRITACHTPVGLSSKCSQGLGMKRLREWKQASVKSVRHGSAVRAEFSIRHTGDCTRRACQRTGRAALSFRCRCSRERIENMLKALGRDEIRSLLEERGKLAFSVTFVTKRTRCPEMNWRPCCNRPLPRPLLLTGDPNIATINLLYKTTNLIGIGGFRYARGGQHNGVDRGNTAG